jgi:hypothetical protein
LLHKIALPSSIPIKDFESIELAKEFGFFTYEEKDSIFHINSIEFLIELRLQQRSTIGHYRFYSEPILILRGDNQSAALGIEYGIKDEKINADYFSISEIGLGKIILFEKEIETRYKKEQSVPFNLSYIAESQKAYLPEIGVLEAILFTLAKKRSKENTISLEDAYGIEWKDLQRAYFEGNTLFLRRIDTILGEGTLRAFDSIKRPSGKDTEKYNQFLIDMKTLEIKIQSS